MLLMRLTHCSQITGPPQRVELSSRLLTWSVMTLRHSVALNLPLTAASLLADTTHCILHNLAAGREQPSRSAIGPHQPHSPPL